MVETEARRGDVFVGDFLSGVVVKYCMAIGIVWQLVSVFRFFLFLCAR